MRSEKYKERSTKPEERSTKYKTPKLVLGLLNSLRARKDTVAYRASKFVRRHPLGVGLTIAALVALSKSRLVIPDSAEVTITIRGHWGCVSQMIRTACAIASTVPTDVPPNFMTSSGFLPLDAALSFTLGTPLRQEQTAP